MYNTLKSRTNKISYVTLFNFKNHSSFIEVENKKLSCN